MEKQKLYFEEPVDWLVLYYYNVQRQDEAEIVTDMERIRMPKDKIDSAIEEIREDSDNSGLTLIDYSRKNICTLLLAPTSFAEFCNTLMHENLHIINNIAKAENMNLLGEPIAYITGSLGSVQSKIIHFYDDLFHGQTECLSCGYKVR